MDSFLLNGLCIFCRDLCIFLSILLSKGLEFEHNQLRKAILSLDHQLRVAEVLCVSP